MGELLIVTFSILGIGLVLVILGTIRKNRWGINLETVNCPRCGKSMPQIRTPSSPSQALWGGFTCDRCGCNIDKWGRVVASRP
jgi:hypothetical protein